MKQINSIGSSAVLEVQLARTNRNGSATRTSLAVTKTPASPVSATISTTSLLVQQNAGAEDVRYEKVATIKMAIEAGTYHIPASAVADKLSGSMLG